MLVKNPPLHSGIIIAIIVAIAVYYFTSKTTAGYELVVTGANPRASKVHGIDVLEIENAVKALWKANIYAESAMGCTGPVIKMPAKHVEKAKAILKENGYL